MMDNERKMLAASLQQQSPNGALNGKLRLEEFVLPSGDFFFDRGRKRSAEIRTAIATDNEPGPLEKKMPLGS